MNIVILAAGQGKRMHSALPKVLQPLAGKALLAHVLATARSLKPRRLCVVHGHGGDAVRAALDAPDLRWALQEPQLGTGHAVQQALPALLAAANEADDFAEPAAQAAPANSTLVLYGDVPLIQAGTLRGLVHSAGDGMSLLTAQLADPTGYGRIVRDANGSVLAIVEEKDATPEQRAIGEINTGIMVLPTARLADWLARLSNDNAQGEYYLTDLVALAVADGVSVHTATVIDAWETAGVNSKAQLAELERIVQRRSAERLMEQGVRLADPARIDVRGELTCGRDVHIDVNCVFEGLVTIDEAAEIGPNCVLRNARIGAGARIAAFSHIDDAIVGPDSVIGPFARLRPGTDLAAGVHVGNFVEIKNSRIAEQSKANHLAYIGDAVIGQRVNVGAGTITCNYDGANKHLTTIEDDAFIGSDTQLVAPVTVGRGATLGAGTTLTRDAPADALTVSRARQVTIPGWKRPQKLARKP